jgi:hypothetical protein
MKKLAIFTDHTVGNGYEELASGSRHLRVKLPEDVSQDELRDYRDYVKQCDGYEFVFLDWRKLSGQSKLRSPGVTSDWKGETTKNELTKPKQIATGTLAVEVCRALLEEGMSTAREMRLLEEMREIDPLLPSVFYDVKTGYYETYKISLAGSKAWPDLSRLEEGSEERRRWAHKYAKLAEQGREFSLRVPKDTLEKLRKPYEPKPRSVPHTRAPAASSLF